MAWEQRELLEYHRCSPTQKGVWDMPRKANTMNPEELSGLCDLGSSPNQQGCFSQSQTEQGTAEVLSQCSSEPGPQGWSFQNSDKDRSCWCPADAPGSLSGTPLRQPCGAGCVTVSSAELGLRWAAGIHSLTTRRHFGGTKIVSERQRIQTEGRERCQKWEGEITWKNQLYIPLNEKCCGQKIPNHRTENRLKHQEERNNYMSVIFCYSSKVKLHFDV